MAALPACGISGLVRFVKESGLSCRMSHSDADDQYPPEEAQRCFEALLRAVLTTPPVRLKDLPRTRPQAERKTQKVSEPPGRS